MSLKDEAWMTQINLLAMGDGRCDTLIKCDNKLAERYGLGFPRYFVPDTASLGSYGAWGARKQHIDNGETIFWDVGSTTVEPIQVNGWKLVLAVDTNAGASDNLGVTNLPNLDVRVVNTCNGNAVVRTAERQGTKYMIHARGSEVRLKCFRVYVTGDGVRAGGEWFWAVDYLFSKSPQFHLFMPP